MHMIKDKPLSNLDSCKMLLNPVEDILFVWFNFIKIYLINYLLD